MGLLVLTLNSLSKEENLKIEEFATLLEEWNRVHNLTGATTKEAIYENILDSIYPISFIQKPKTLLDIGSGAGFPAMLLAIVLPNTEVVLCEPIKKRASFLKYTSTILGLKNIRVEAKRVEDIDYPPFNLITSRAVMDTKFLLDISKNLSDENTEYLFYKGERVYDEIESLQLNYDIVSKNRRNYLYIKKKL